MATNAVRNRVARMRHENERPHERVRMREPQRRTQSLDRAVLDQAIAINGEVRVKLFGLNLLPIQVRLLVSSKDVAAELGLDWWQANRNGASRRNGTKRPTR
jgi:hypothetical protein